MLLCREILVAEPYRYKVGTRERGQAWDEVASALNLVESLHFVDDKRDVSGIFPLLKSKIPSNFSVAEILIFVGKY